MFFNDQRSHFFRPLVGKYREIIVECVRLLYLRLYTDLSGYGHGRSREFIMDVFIEAIARAPELDGDDEGGEGRFKSARELASFILNQLLENGWIERQLDEATLQSHYSFSRFGRAFTQPFIDTGAADYRSRNRNTRNTRNSMQAFLDNGEVYDLLDAYEYSERIISDFTDTISELEERRLQLVKEVESRQLIEQAADQFFEFIETVFKPDLEVRLSADSVEKYRDQISQLIKQIRRRRPFGGESEQSPLLWQTVMELRLRKLLPGRVVDNQSLLENILCGIEERLRGACEIMLPALRKALNSFTARADIIIRQLSYLHTQSTNPVLDYCTQLRQLDHQQQDAQLSQLGGELAQCRAGFVASEQLQLRTRSARRVVSSRVNEDAGLDETQRREQFVNQRVDQACHVSSQMLRDFVKTQLLESGQLRSCHLSVTDARELLSMAYLLGLSDTAIEDQQQEYSLRIKPASEDALGMQRFAPLADNDDYFVQREEFILELVKLA